MPIVIIKPGEAPVGPIVSIDPIMIRDALLSIPEEERGFMSEAAFNAHAHNYRKITQVGGDSSDKWMSPTLVDVADDTTTHAAEPADLEAVGVTVATEPTSTPV